MSTKVDDPRLKKLRSEVPIVTIHGYKGSVLKRGDTVVWITAAQVFHNPSCLTTEAAGVSTPDLTLPLKWTDHGGGFKTQARDDVTAAHTLKGITVVPFVYEPEIYGNWLKKARTIGRHSYEFSYDWRRSNIESLGKFITYLNWISTKHYGSKVQIVAHSMGSLITMAAVHHVPHLVHSILFAGGPLRGGPGLMPDLHLGTMNAMNKEILNPKVLFTFPSLYTIAHAGPEDHPEDPEYTGLLDTDGTNLPMDWYDIEWWKKYRFSVLGDYPPDKIPPEVEEHLKNCLSDGKRLRSYINPRKGFKYPPIIIMAAGGLPTPCGLRRDPREPKGWESRTFCSDGDGRVPLSFTVPLEGLPHKYYKIQGFTHEYLLNEPRLPKWLDDMLLECDEKGETHNPQYMSKL